MFDWNLLNNVSIPIYVKQGSPCFRLASSDWPRLFVISIPKSGTYFIAEILKRLGFFYSQVHLSTHDVFDQRFGAMEDLRRFPNDFRTVLPLFISSQLILPGQFTVGHIPWHCHELLRGFKKIICLRELRNVVISATKYYSFIRENRSIKNEAVAVFKELPLGEEKIKLWLELWGTEFADLINAMQPWTTDPEVFVIDFDNLSQNETLHRLTVFLGLELPEDMLRNIYESSFRQTTVTLSDQPSDYRIYWTDSLEKIFQFYFAKVTNIKNVVMI